MPPNSHRSARAGQKPSVIANVELVGIAPKSMSTGGRFGGVVTSSPLCLSHLCDHFEVLSKFHQSFGDKVPVPNRHISLLP